MDKATYVILGNSAAATHAVEAIRELDAVGTIILVARERQHVYSRPLISYRLAGKVDDSRMDYRGRDWYAKHRVETILGVEATGVDGEKKVVTLGGEGILPLRPVESATATRPTGETPVRRKGGTPSPREIGFEKLLIATGGSPIKPPIEGLDSKGVFTFTTWDDEQAIDQYIRSRGVKRAVVLGGGLIGLKTVEALVERNVGVTVVELADRLLAVTFDHAAAKLAARSLADKNVEIRTKATIKKVVSDQGAVRGVILSEGDLVECDLLVVAIGVRPDLSLVAGSAIKTDRGIVVDDRQATSVPGIYAAGDVAQVADALGTASRPMPILPAASRQGRIAGVNMAGGEARYEGGVAMNAVDVVGLPTISVGQTVEADGDEVLSRLDEETRTYRKIVLRKDRVIGAIFIGQIQRAGIFTGLIRSKLDVSSFKHLLLSDEFGLLSLPSDYRSHMVRGAGIEV
jgi:NAD(P)H-nitrite reductase large subunit